MSDLLETRCRCGVMVMRAPRSTNEALCMQCRMDETGAIANYDPKGQWHPTVGYASPGHGPVAVVVEREPYPVPEVTSRDDVMAARAWALAQSKSAVTDLIKAARTVGFEVVIQYACGHFPHASYGTPGELKESIAVVMTRDSMRAVAVYAGAGKAWSWDTLAIQRPGWWPVRMGSLATFLDGLLGPMHQPVKAARPMEGPARRALKVHGPLAP